MQHYALEPIGELSAVFDSFTGETHFVSPPLSDLLNKKPHSPFTPFRLRQPVTDDDYILEQQLASAIKLGMIKAI